MRAPLVFDERTSSTDPSPATEAPLRPVRRRLLARAAAGDRVRGAGADPPRRARRLSRVLHDSPVVLLERLSLQLHELGRVRQLQGLADRRPGLPRRIEVPT